MSMKFTDLHCKEVICVSDGRRLGFIGDILVEVPEGKVTAVVVPAPGKLMGLGSHSADFIIPPTNLSTERHLRTTNYLLSNWRAIGYVYKEAHGVKDSSSTQAGHCLITTASNDDLDLVSVVLGAKRVTLANGKEQVQSFLQMRLSARHILESTHKKVNKNNSRLQHLIPL